MSTTSKTDAELLAAYKAGYGAFWQSREARTGQSGPRRDHAAGLRAVAAVAWEDACAAMAWAIENGPLEAAYAYVASNNRYADPDRMNTSKETENE